jgi:hypothetical protein
MSGKAASVSKVEIALGFGPGTRRLLKPGRIEALQHIEFFEAIAA